MKGLLAILFSTACSVLAANWHVDNAATGSNNGTSWANAWPDMTNVVWGGAGVTAGDTLYISGGSTSKTYTNEWTIGAGGTLGNRINIRVGQDAGHNGTVIFDGSKYGVSCPVTAAITCFQPHVTISGESGGATNFVIRNWFNSTNKNIGRGITMSDPAHFPEVFFCVFSNINTGIYMSSLTNIVIGWCKLTPWGDTCMALGDTKLSPPNYWDSHLVFSNEMYCIYNDATGGPDGVQGGQGVSVFGNRFEAIEDNTLTNRLSNHTDFWQCGDNVYNKLYNNECINNADSAFSPAPFTAGYGLSNVRIYNNIFRITKQIDPFPQYIRMYNQVGLGGYTNVHILNNLFIDRTNATQALYIGPEIGNNPGTNNVLANNIFVNVGMATGLTWELAKSDGAGQSQWTITNNILYHPTPGDARVGYLGTNYTVAQWKAIFDPSTGTNMPAFVNYTPYQEANDFNLLSSDTAAIGKGLNFSDIFTTDYNGNARGATWDIGPYEAISYTMSISGAKLTGGRIGQ